MTLAATAGVCAGQQLIAGPNVNMGGGPAGRTTVDPLWYNQVYGDVSLQRQNEGSMACSSRNPTTCLAAGNDYRLVDVPGVNDGKVTADSWLGIYWTRNGGATWRSSLLPGWTTGVPGFNDVSPEGQASPIRGLEASADPTVRAGTHGLFYVSGIAFNRAGENASSGMSGGEGKKGVHFVAVFVDDNNTSDPDVPPRYLWTVITDSGTSGQFLDKPWLAVDIPRGTATCMITAGDAGVPATTISAGTAYVAYATFLGEGNNPHSEVWVRKSTDCGQTWGSAAKLTASVPLSQSPMIAINPINGNVHVVWREFGMNGGADRILTAKSNNFGKTFTKPVVLDDLGKPAPLSAAFDQYTLPNSIEMTLRMARTNDYPAICIGTDELVRVVFSKRLESQVSRIVLTTSKDGTLWSSPVELDNHTGPGHQFQPSIACTGSKATAFWLDQRHDNAFWLLNVEPLLEYVLGPFIRDLIGGPPTHTIDSRAKAIALDAAGHLVPGPSIQVSRYQVRYDPNAHQFAQLQFNPWNLPLFASGRVPFNGDYAEIIARNPFKPPVGDEAWKFNDFADESPVLHAVWTDNRDVLRDPLPGNGTITDEDFTTFGAPETDACTAESLTWTRNQNLYTAVLGSGLVMQAEGNARRTPNALKHGYVIRMQNLVLPAAGAVAKRFRLSFEHGTGDESFDWKEGRVATIDVTIPAFSAIARTVFIPRGSTTSFEVKAEELDSDHVLANGLKGSTVIVPDPTAPEDTATADGETHDVFLAPLATAYSNNLGVDPDTGDPIDPSYTYANPAYFVGAAYTQEQFLDNVFNPSYITPSYITPSYITPSYITPSYITPSYITPSYITPSYITPSYITPSYITPSYITPSYITPSYITPSYITPSYITLPVVTDSNYVAINMGNVTSGYDLKAMLQSLPEDAIFQLQVNRLYAEPSPGSQGCALGQQLVAQSLANVTNTGGDGTATFSLAPKEFAIITLRVACSAGPCFDPNNNVTIKVTAQAPNCESEDCTPIPDEDVIDHAPPILTLPTSLSVPATSPAGAVVTFTELVSANDVIAGPVEVMCTPPSGSIFPVGTTTVQCTAKDRSANTGSGTFTVTVTNAAPVPDNQTITVIEDTPAIITLTANDVEGDAVAYKVWTLPQSGTLSQSGTAITTVPFNLTGPVVTYVPNSNFNGSDSFTFKAADYLHDSGEGVVTIAVTPVNDAPAVPATFHGGTVASGTTKTWSISDLASDVDSVLTVQEVTQAPQHGTVAITSNGGIAYTAGTFAGDDTFTYVVSDGMFSASTTMTVTVTYGTPFLFNGLLSPYAPPPKSSNAGSSTPLIWQYTNASGVPIDSSYAVTASLVTLTFTRLTWASGETPPNCEGGVEAELVGVSTDYPGNSSFQYFSEANPHPTYGAYTWQFNWQTGPPVTAGCYKIRVILDDNGNNDASRPVPDAADLVREFLIKLK